MVLALGLASSSDRGESASRRGGSLSWTDSEGLSMPLQTSEREKERMNANKHSPYFLPPGKTTFALFMMIAEMSSTGIWRMLFFCSSGILLFSQ